MQLAHKEHEITVLNRGNIRIGLDGVRELTADRHDKEALMNLHLEDEGFEAVVDFCAYVEGDIASVAGLFGEGKLGRYIFISTVDVYKKGTGLILTEDSPLEDDPPPGEVGEYIKGKVLLEEELRRISRDTGIKGVSVRPAILYGPGNYAPRESIYFKWIAQAGQIIHPEGSDGFFQMIYVKDAAGGIVSLLDKEEEALMGAYNLCPDETVDYAGFEKALKSAAARMESYPDYETLSVDVSEVIRRGIPLPFPLLRAESETVSGARTEELIPDMTSLEEGLYGCLKVS